MAKRSRDKMITFWVTEDELAKINANMERLALANSQRSANLLGNHHSSQFVDSPHYARCSHKYAASFYSAFCPLSQYGFKPAGLFAHKRWQRLTNHVSFAQ